MFWRSRSARASFALICASRTRLRASDFELMFTTCEPYDAAPVLLYHLRRHHRLHICLPPMLPSSFTHQHNPLTPTRTARHCPVRFKVATSSLHCRRLKDRSGRTDAICPHLPCIFG